DVDVLLRHILERARGGLRRDRQAGVRHLDDQELDVRSHPDGAEVMVPRCDEPGDMRAMPDVVTPERARRILDRRPGDARDAVGSVDTALELGMTRVDARVD